LAGLFSRSHKEWSQPIAPALTNIFRQVGIATSPYWFGMPNHKLETATAAVKNVSLTHLYGENNYL
jgi:hypothetical protein